MNQELKVLYNYKNDGGGVRGGGRGVNKALKVLYTQ